MFAGQSAPPSVRVCLSIIVALANSLFFSYVNTKGCTFSVFDKVSLLQHGVWFASFVSFFSPCSANGFSTKPTTRVVYSGDGEYIACGGSTLFVWSTKTGELVKSVEMGKYVNNGVCFFFLFSFSFLNGNIPLRHISTRITYFTAPEWLFWCLAKCSGGTCLGGICVCASGYVVGTIGALLLYCCLLSVPMAHGCEGKC